MSDTDRLTLDPEVVAGLRAFFQPIAEKALPPVGTDFSSSMLRIFAESRQEHWKALLAVLDSHGPEYDVPDVYYVIRELVEEGTWLRAKAYNSPDFDHSQDVGGCFCRMFIHDQSPDADYLDRLALALANAIPGLDAGQRIRLCI